MDGELQHRSLAYRAYALEAWEVALGMKDPEARRIMREIAAGYDRLASLDEEERATELNLHAALRFPYD